MNSNRTLLSGSKTIVLWKTNCSVGDHKFKLNCLRDKEMNVSTSALVDSNAECSDGKCNLNFKLLHTNICIYCSSCLSSDKRDVIIYGRNGDLTDQ